MPNTVSPRNIGFLLLALALLYLFFSIRVILTPFIVGALFAYLMDPLADRLESLKLNRTLAVSSIFLLISLVVLVVLLFIMPLLFEQLMSFIQQLPHILQWIQTKILPLLAHTMGLDSQIDVFLSVQQLLTQHWQQAGNVLSNIIKTAGISTLSVMATMANLLLIPVVGFYLLRDWDLLTERLLRLIPVSRQALTVNFARQCDEVLSAFIRGQLWVMVGLTVIYSMGLAIVGVKLALFLGVLAGLASIVPYLGFIVGICTASLVAYFQFQTATPLIGVAIVFLVGQVAESVVLTPWLVGDKIGLHPVAVIFAIMAGGQLAGFVGVLVALPVAAVLMVFIRYFYQHYQNSTFYQDNNEL